MKKACMGGIGLVALAVTLLAWPIIVDQTEYVKTRYHMAIRVAHIRHEKRMITLEQRSDDARTIARWGIGG